MKNRLLRWLPSALLITALVALAVGYLLHFGASTVLSQSMSPTFQRGDLVVTRLVAATDLRVGDVPAIVPPGGTTPFVHRITAIHTGTGAPTVSTKGDANPAPDAGFERLTTTRVPVVVAVLPRLGWPGLFIHGRRARSLLITLIGLTSTAIAVGMVLHVPAPLALTPPTLTLGVPDEHPHDRP